MDENKPEVPYPLALAALAAAAAPKMQINSVVEPQYENELEETTGLLDAQGNRWIITSLKQEKTRQEIEQYAAVLAWMETKRQVGLLGFNLPLPQVFAHRGQNRYAMIYRQIGGRPLSQRELKEGSKDLAISLGMNLATLHNLPLDQDIRGVVKSTSPLEARGKTLETLSKVKDCPPRLLERWLEVCKDESVWFYTPSFTHCGLNPSCILVDSRVVVGISGFFSAQVADPAWDLAWLLQLSPLDFVERVVEHYSSKRQAVDLHVLTRAKFYQELTLVTYLLQGYEQGNLQQVGTALDLLAQLDNRLAGTRLVEKKRKVEQIVFTPEQDPLVKRQNQLGQGYQSADYPKKPKVASPNSEDETSVVSLSEFQAKQTQTADARDASAPVADAPTPSPPAAKNRANSSAATELLSQKAKVEAQEGSSDNTQETPANLPNQPLAWPKQQGENKAAVGQTPTEPDLAPRIYPRHSKLEAGKETKPKHQALSQLPLESKTLAPGEANPAKAYTSLPTSKPKDLDLESQAYLSQESEEYYVLNPIDTAEIRIQGADTWE